MITPGPGYMVDPTNPNGVVPIGSVPVATPTANSIAGNPAPTSGVINRTTAPTTNNQPTYSSTGVAVIPQGGTAGVSSYIPPPPPPAPQPTVDPRIANQGKPGYDVFGNPVAGVTTAGNGVVAGSNGTATGSTIPTNTDISRTGTVTSQAKQANTDVTQSAEYQQQKTLYNDAYQTYQNIKNAIADYNKQAGRSTDVLGTVMGREGENAKAYAGQLDAAAQAMTSAQAYMNNLTSAYSAQSNALNNTSTQTQPSNQTQQVGSNTTVLGADGKPIATTPLIETAGIPGSYNGTPTTYNNGIVNTASGANPTTYNVVKGDTLSAIAARQGVSLGDLEAANPQIKDFNKIEVGDQVNLPKTSVSAFDAGTVAGQKSAGENIVAQKSAYAQAQTIHSQISSLLTANPNLNSNPTAIGNAINQWANSTQVPSGPYVNLLNDLQEYANTIAPVLGVGGAPTDNKTAIANNLIPMLASGQTIDQALTNLETLAAGKITAAQTVGKNPSAPVQAPVTGNMKVNSTGGIYDF